MPERNKNKFRKENEIFENYDFDDPIHHDDYNQEYWGMGIKQFITFMHLSQFAGLVVPAAGYALPVIMWLRFKDENPEIDAHGKNILNWMISFLLYAFISAILIFVLIGIPLLLALGVVAVVFPIMGAIKADQNEIFKYPMSIEFIK